MTSVKPEVLFTVQMLNSRTSQGNRWTMQLVNPDGSVCVEKSLECGPHGFTLDQEAEMAEWVGIEAEDFMNVMFDSAWEEAQAPHTNRP